MKNTSKKLGVILLTSALLFSESAFAARMGKSSNLGMQRSNTTSQSSYQPSSNTSTAAQPQKKGLGVGSVVAGAAAGAVGGYLLGKAMNSNESSTNNSQSSGSSIPWGVIGILGMLLVIGLMIFRRKTAPATNSANFNGSAPNNNGFQIPTINRDNANYNAQSQNNPGAAPMQATYQNMERMADGVEAQFFLRQAKGMFLHIQSMNTPDNVSEVAKYMTPDLYSEVKSMITGNDYVADFSQLDCQYLQSSIENGQYVASAKFFGKVSESPNSPVVDFSEIWHFVKPTGVDGAKWLVAGIQQVTTNN